MTTTTLCPRCSGSGQYTRNGFQYGTCFTCNGTGQTAVLQSGKSRHRRPAFDLDGVTFGFESQASVPTPTQSNINLATIASDVRDQIAFATTKLERDLKGWTRIELDALAETLRTDILSAIETRAPRRIELTRSGIALPEPEGHQHPAFAKLLRLATARDVNGFVPNIWLAGPAGSGKTTGARNLAKALDVPFFYNGALSTDFQVLGYNDAGGTYHTTAFRQAVTQPSVYLFDDIDSCDSNAPLLALNGALANGLITFPDAQVERHPDCICIATANTWGLGATADYVGRVKIDAAFLSRFPGRIEWGYDEEFEAAICGNAEWARQVQSVRAKARALGLKVVIDPRASIAGAAYIAAGFEPDEVAEMTYLANLNPEQRRALQ